ncbi:MAG: hypothetical protein IJJ69_13945 [Oscillospiraceae bacterium]|nr:hypothetical protein [Oscillospiraceae bacterium]
MKLFEIFKKKSFPPLVCRPADIIDFFQECLNIGAPEASFEIEYKKQVYPLGISSDYTQQKGFFDIKFYLDTQEFDTLEDFCANAKLQNQLFMNLETIKILRDLDYGDPRNNILLEKREIKKG